MSDTQKPGIDTVVQPRPDEWKIIAAGALLTLSGSAIYFLVPFYVGSMMESLSLTPAQAGILSGCEYYAIAITSLLGPFWIRRFSWRKLALFGVVVACTGHALTMMLDSFPLIVATRSVTGLLGEGILYSISFAVLGETRNPGKGFGVAMAVSIVTTSIIIYFSPPLTALLGRNGIVAALLCLTLIMAALIVWVPTGSIKHSSTSKGNAAHESAGRRSWFPLLGLVSVAIWFVGPGGFWAFAERMADLQGVPAAKIALGFSLANAIGVVGPLFAGWLGCRFGRNLPAIASTVVMVLVVYLYCGTFNSQQFTLYVVLYSTIWAFGSVYFFEFIAAIDWNGKLNVLTPGFQTIGLGGGPLIMGFLVGSDNYSAIGWSHALFSLLALLIFVPIAWRIASRAPQNKQTPEVLIESGLR